MALSVNALELRSWRSFTERTISFGPGLSVLHGKNAAGKTNVIEALQLLTAGNSFRHPTPIQLVHNGAAKGRAAARLTGDGRLVDVSCEVSAGSRIFRCNGKRVHAYDMPKTLMSVLFCPDDLSLIKRGASGRRDELDSFGRQLNGAYARVLSAYLRAIEQRNRLLREEWVDADLLTAWDESVSVGGATLLLARLRLVERLRPHMTRIYEEVSAGEELSCEYLCSLGDDIAHLERDALAEHFRHRLIQSRKDDLRRHQTTLGPHRDDLRFLIDGQDARSFASQGQQRTITLAWKMAEVELAEELTGNKPLLLLDDVMSELDETRRVAATRFVHAGMQTVITTANLGYFSDELLRSAEVISIERQS